MILSIESFIELNILGKNYQIVRFEASNFLDRHFIQDMLDCKDEAWKRIEKEEYDKWIEKTKSKYNKMSGSL